MNDRQDVDDVQTLPGGVEVRVSGPIATVSLVRPEVRNAQTFTTWRSLEIAAGELPADVAVVLLRGTGADFSAGLDLRMLHGGHPGAAGPGAPGPSDERPGAAGPSDEGSMAELLALDDAGRELRIAGFQRAFRCWREIDPVVIAIVQGRAIGAGFQLALAADLRIAAAGASFVMAEVQLGLVPDLGGTHRLVRLVGYARALRICATAQPVDAATALGWGLIDELVDDAELDVRATGLAERLAGVGAGLLAEHKGLLRRADERGYSEQLAAERETQARLIGRLR